eukprot:tig00020562_g11178.t1
MLCSLDANSLSLAITESVAQSIAQSVAQPVGIRHPEPEPVAQPVGVCHPVALCEPKSHAVPIPVAFAHG